MHRSEELASLFDQWFHDADESPHLDLDPQLFEPEPPIPPAPDGASTNRLELISVIWQALESLASPDLLVRVGGLDRLIEFDTVRQLPLVAYILVTRLKEPDIEFRTRIVKTISGMINSIGSPAGPSFEVQETLLAQLGEMRTREIFALLQVAEYDKSAEPSIADLMGFCSDAGNHLAQILANRDAPKDIRKQAASFIGRIGYLDALPTLERMTTRLENRRDEETDSLLPAVLSAVQQLNLL